MRAAMGPPKLENSDLPSKEIQFGLQHIAHFLRGSILGYLDLCNYMSASGCEFCRSAFSVLERQRRKLIPLGVWTRFPLLADDGL